MSSNNRNFSRPLNCRERRRLKVLQMLPVDIIDPSSSVQDLIEKFQVKQLYRYGSKLDETIIEIESNNADAKGKMFSQLRERLRSRMLTSEGDSLDEPNLIFEPTSMKFSVDKFRHLIPPDPPVKALLMFHKDDQVSDAMTRSCERLHIEVSRAKNVKSALEIIQNPIYGGHNLVIVDGRCKSIDTELFVKVLRKSIGAQNTQIVAVVKRSLLEKDDKAIQFLLDLGYNTCIIASPSVSVCTSELRLIQHSLIRPGNVIATQHSLYAALHRVGDAIIITDDALRIQHANKMTERLLGWKVDELVGGFLQNLLNSDASLLLSQTDKLEDFAGAFSIDRKMLEPTLLHVRAFPVACLGRSTTHVVLTLNPQESSQETDLQSKNPSSSIHSTRRESFDVRSLSSDGTQRLSLAELSSLPAEVRITKVLSILLQVQENCPKDEAKLWDRLIELLKPEGSSQVWQEDFDGTSSIPVSTSDAPGRDSIDNQPSSTKFNTTPQVFELLSCALDWDFDIFRLEELTDNRPLFFLGLELFRRFDVFSTFKCDEATFRAWLIVVESNYHEANAYHNSTHAADVMQAMACYLQQLANRDLKMDRLDEACALIVAAVHDIDHPGRSSTFLCNSDDSLALLYNDICVLESHHAATAFRVTLTDDKINIFKNLDRDVYKRARAIIIDMTLATEMTKHFEHLAKFVSVFGSVDGSEDLPNDDDSRVLIRRMLIKCADVSNPTRPLKFCVEWARRIAEEYFTQTDEEKRKGMPIVLPLFDRTSCSISKTQIGFIEFIIQDMMNAWDGFIDMPELMQHLQYNYEQWKVFEELGINTLNDLKRMQASILNASRTSVKFEEMM